MAQGCSGSCPKCGSGCFRKGEHEVHCCENVTCGHTWRD